MYRLPLWIINARRHHSEHTQQVINIPIDTSNDPPILFNLTEDDSSYSIQNLTLTLSPHTIFGITTSIANIWHLGELQDELILNQFRQLRGMEWDYFSQQRKQ